MKQRIFLVILLVGGLFILEGCAKKKPFQIPRYEIAQEMDEAITEEVNGEYEEFESNPLYDQRYSPQTVYVAAGQDFRDALYASQPEIRSHEELNNVGGAKLIAEMSADKAGISTSAYNTDYLLSIRPLHELKLTIDNNPAVIYNRIYSGDIALNTCYIGGNLLGLQVKFSLRNQTSEEIEVVIPLGQMIESTRNDVQNVVISQEKTIILQPYESVRFSIPALCAAKMRGGPSGSAARVTPYVMNAPYHVFSNQESVWNFQKEPNIFPVVFYAWGRGDRVGNGNVSTAGHAFAHIPRVGYIGFGAANGEMFGDEGRIFDHSYQHRFATDSCTVYLTQYQLENVYQTIDDLIDSPPNYYVGYYDCTSFVMDIADAAGVYYGNRLFIQTPMGFIQQMKQYNEIR